jgi:hypothetical protein
LEQYFFVFIAFPLSPFGLSGTFAVGSLFFPYVRRGSGVLSLTTHAHPLFSFFLPGQHNTNTTQHLWEAHPAWDSNPADLAVVSEECRSSFHHPTVSPERHTHIHGPAEVPSWEKNPPASVSFEPTSAGTATSEHCLRQPCGQRATLWNSI